MHFMTYATSFFAFYAMHCVHLVITGFKIELFTFSDQNIKQKTVSSEKLNSQKMMVSPDMNSIILIVRQLEIISTIPLSIKENRYETLRTNVTLRANSLHTPVHCGSTQYNLCMFTNYPFLCHHGLSLIRVLGRLNRIIITLHAGCKCHSIIHQHNDIMLKIIYFK